MSSDKHCCVPGCKDSGGMSSVLHGFPNPEKDRVRFNTWLHSIGSDNLLSLENAHIYKYRRVCHRHFQDKYHCRNNRISNIAVPTLFLPGLNTTVQSHLKLSGAQKEPLQEHVHQPIPSTSAEFNLQSYLKIPGVGKNTLQELVHQPIPSTSAAPQSHLQLIYKTESIVENTIQEENIDPEIVVYELVTPSTCPTIEQNLAPQSHLQLMYETESIVENTIQEENIDSEIEVYGQEPPSPSPTIEQKCRKISASTHKVSRNERALQLKLQAARRKIYKLKNKVKKQAAQIKEAKRNVANPAVLQNCSSTAKLLMRLLCREDKKKDKGRRFTLQEKITALSIFKQSPKAYRILRKIFILPAIQTLTKIRA